MKLPMKFKKKTQTKPEKNLKEKGKKSIRKDFLRTVLLLVTSIIILLSGFSVYSIYTSTKYSLEVSMQETSKLISEKIAQRIETFGIICSAIGNYYDNTSNNVGELIMYLGEVSNRYQFTSIDILDSNLKSVITTKAYASDSAAGKVSGAEGVLSNPIVEGNNIHFEYARRINNNIVVINIPYSVFEEIIKSVQIGNTGSTYILDKTGAKVAHNDATLVAAHQNNLEEVLKDPKLYGEVAALETKMTQGESGFGFYTWKGDKKFGSYAPIAQTDGWSVNVTALESEFMSQLKVAAVAMVGMGIIILLFAALIIWRTVKRIVGPIETIQVSIDEVYNGNLSVEIPVNRKDEIGQMAEKINGMVSVYKTIIEDISSVLGAIADKSLLATTQAQYPGDFNQIKESLNEILTSLSEVIGQFHTASSQVRSGAEQVSFGAQTLSQSVTEQAATVEELFATIDGVTRQIDENASAAAKGSEKMIQVGEGLEESNRKMNDVILAMEEIDTSSKEIGKIIKTIQDIAFQTNILALNAAVEAARAGEAGKGFSVVADEVRNLASKCAEAAQNTTDLIESSISAVKNGTANVDETASVLSQAVSMANDASKIIQEIAQSAVSQASAMDEIHVGIGQVSDIVQSNSATAEESAAASEELLAQADLLQEHINKFQLKDFEEDVIAEYSDEKF